MPMTSVVWLRRDLRLRDNVAIERAARGSDALAAVFVLDPAILYGERTGRPIVNAFLTALSALRRELRELGSDLAVLYGDPAEVVPAFVRRIGAQRVAFNIDYEPYARRRDERMTALLREANLEVERCIDHVVFGAHEVARKDGEPYKVFTPYARAWNERWNAQPRYPVDSLRSAHGKWLPRAAIGSTRETLESAEFGIKSFDCGDVSERGAHDALEAFAQRASRYALQRDFPAADVTSHLSPHLRAGTIGIRTCVTRALEAHAPVWLNELVWREFYQMVLARYPQVEMQSFLPQGDRVAWRSAANELLAWSEGRTGYPIVDAAMRQLNETGWMHNRLRMIAASFLVKHLLVDWHEGERIFEQRLMDADMAQNNGGWQWCASTGTDAAPYFRIFNPVVQARKFDPGGAFVKAMIPQLRDLPARLVHEPWKAGGVPGYPPPIVEHAFARERALRAYEAAFAR